MGKVHFYSGNRPREARPNWLQPNSSETAHCCTVCCLSRTVSCLPETQSHSLLCTFARLPPGASKRHRQENHNRTGGPRLATKKECLGLSGCVQHCLPRRILACSMFNVYCPAFLSRRVPLKPAINSCIPRLQSGLHVWQKFRNNVAAEVLSTPRYSFRATCLRTNDESGST